MYTAIEKQNTNIVEYVLYMWQIEDLIRSCKMDIDIIQSRIISKYDVSEQAKEEIKKWYERLIKAMEKQQLEEKGHLSEINELITELSFLHNSLLNLYNDTAYIRLHQLAANNIAELQKRSGGKNTGDITTCLNGLYGLLLLKLQKKEVSKETAEAMTTFSQMLGFLSKKYREIKEGKFELPEKMKN